MSPQRLWSGAALAVVVAVLSGGCTDDPKLGTGTLPSIVTTTTVVTTTTIAGVPQQTFYEIKPGDTLSAIARSFGLAPELIMAANGITDPNHIEIGQRLEIPPPTAVIDQLPGATTTAAAPADATTLAPSTSA